MIIADLSPCIFATARTLYDAGMATHQQLVWNAGMAQNLSDVIYADVAEQLVRSGIFVPEDKKPVLGEDFSRLVDYNNVLGAYLLADKPADSSFEEAMFVWASRLNPFRQNILAKEEYSNKYAFSGDYAVLGAGAYLRENLALEMPDSVRAGLAERLKTAAEIKLECRLGREQQTLAMLAENADVVIEAYKRILRFRDDFRAQIRFVAEAQRKTSAVKRTMLYFLDAPIAKHLKV